MSFSGEEEKTWATCKEEDEKCKSSSSDRKEEEKKDDEEIYPSRPVLHLVGSPTSDLQFHCSLLYARFKDNLNIQFNSHASDQFFCPFRSLLESDFVGHTFKGNVIAAIHPDGLWSFPSHLNKEEEEEERHSTTEALKVIETLAPVVMVQHMQCEKRPLYTALLEVLFYYTYKFSYCSPFSSRFLTSPALAQTLKCQLI